MSSEWGSALVDDIKAPSQASIAIGPFGSRMKSDCYVGQGVKVVRGTNISSGRTFSGDFVFVTPDKAQELGGANLRPNDLVFPHRGSIGEVGIVPDDGEQYVISSSLMKLTCDPLKAFPLFIYYFFKSEIGRYELLKNASQVGTPGIGQPLASLKSISVPLPPLNEQKNIAAFLGALDDRITLLRETNATLEAIAQALFKSWFVDFDPVRAKAEGRARQDGGRSGQPRMPQASDLPRPGAGAGAEAQGQPEGMDATTAVLFPDSFDESELGLVPKGWRVGKVEDVMDLPYGKALKATDRIDGVVPVYGSGGITGYHNESLVDGPSIIVGRKGTVGSLYWEDRPFFPIDTVFYVKAKQPLTYCYYLLQTLGLEGMNTDGAVPGLNRNNAYRLQVVMPSAPALQAFDEIVGVIRGKIFSNSQQAQTLTQLRDTLLPRLISGQLRLPDAEQTVEEALA